MAELVIQHGRRAWLGVVGGEVAQAKRVRTGNVAGDGLEDHLQVQVRRQRAFETRGGQIGDGRRQVQVQQGFGADDGDDPLAAVDGRLRQLGPFGGPGSGVLASLFQRAATKICKHQCAHEGKGVAEITQDGKDVMLALGGVGQGVAEDRLPGGRSDLVDCGGQARLESEPGRRGRRTQISVDLVGQKRMQCGIRQAEDGQHHARSEQRGQ